MLIHSLIGMIVSWFIFIIVALIGNVAMERDVIDTGRRCWSFTLQNSTCKMMYPFTNIMSSMHRHTFAEHTHKPATSIAQKKAEIPSPMMVPTTTPAITSDDKLDRAVGEKR